MISRNESGYVWLVIIGIIIITILPYFYAEQMAGSGFVFGGLLMNPLDGNSYLAKMYEGWRGDFLFTLPYTAEKGNGSFLHFFYLLLGHLARLIGLSLSMTYHIARGIGTIAMLLSLHRFFKFMVSGRYLRILAFTLAGVGSGVGWIALLFGAITSDFWVAEAYPFLSAYTNPHFSLGLAILLWLLVPVRPVDKSFGLLETLVIFFGAFALGIISPFGVVVALSVLGVETLLVVRLRKWSTDGNRCFNNFEEYLHAGRSWVLSNQGRIFWIILGGGPVLLYYLWVTLTDPLLAGWNSQNLTPSPPIWDLAIALSPVIILAVHGARDVMKENAYPQRLLVIWAGVGIAFLYLPFGLQRRFMMGLYIPLTGLAILGLDDLLKGMRDEAVRRRRFRFLTVVLFLFVLPTNLVILLSTLHGIQTHDPMLYLTHGEDRALSWLVKSTSPNSLILAAPETGLFIPAHTGRRVIYGHPFETVNAEEEKEVVQQFFLGIEGFTSQNQALVELVNRDVDYIFFGPRERALSGLDSLIGFTAEYDGEGVTIYAVER